jgi:RNA polymerase sigma-70 factor (ECF subfamily)
MAPASSLVPDDERSPGTLGAVLYGKASKAPVSEAEWVGLVRAVASGDQRALHALYERAHRAVFTLSMRITANRETAEEVTVDVFHDVWRRASGYHEADGTVLGWIMNQARSRAIDRLRFEQRKKRVPSETRELPAPNGAVSPDVLLAFQAAKRRASSCAGCADSRRAPGDRDSILL